MHRRREHDAWLVILKRFMVRPETTDVNMTAVRAATDTPRDLELARRLSLLVAPGFDADCAHSMRPVVIRLLYWGGIAAAAWWVMSRALR